MPSARYSRGLHAGERERAAEIGREQERQRARRLLLGAARRGTRRDSAPLRRGRRVPWTRAPRSGRPRRAARPAGSASFSVAVAVVSPYAAVVSSRSGSLTRSGISNASVSPPSVTVIRTRGAAGRRVRARRTSPTPTRPARGGPSASSRRRTAACPGSRLRIVTTASPASLPELVTTAPNDARSPLPRKRGNAGSIVSGFVTRISRSPKPNCDAMSPATAMMRYVVSESGSVTVVVARPSAPVVADPSQKTSGRKSWRISVPAVSGGCARAAGARRSRQSHGRASPTPARPPSTTSADERR